MELAFPWALLLLVPWLAAAWRMCRAARARGATFAGASARLAGAGRSWRARLCRALPFVALAGALGLIVGAAGPRRAVSREVRAADALAVMMAVDVSGSMRGLDLSEGRWDATRLDVVKRLFRDFVAQRPDDLIGLVTFGGFASVRAPLTADHRALLHTLAGVEIPGGETGYDAQGRPVSEEELLTAIGDGLAVALLRLKDAEPKTKVVILLSDGENTAGAVTPMEAARAAKELGVRVYTIGVGANGPTKIRVRNRLGQTLLADVAMTLDEATLKAIAKETGGRYANVRAPRDLEAFLREVSSLETTRVERQVYTRYRACARPWLLGGGALCLFAAFALTALIRRPL